MYEDDDHKTELLSSLLTKVELPHYDKDKASELFYSLSELGFYDGDSWSPRDAEIFFRAFILAQNISDEDLEIIRM